MTIKYSVEFIADLDKIETIYRDILFIPDSGKKLISGLLETCDKIEKYPLIGIDLKTKTDIENGYRFVVYNNYLLFYTVAEGIPTMTRVLDGRIDYLKVLFNKTNNQTD